MPRNSVAVSIDSITSIKELLEHARKAEHDSLGISSDIESLKHLANSAKEQFFAGDQLWALLDWGEALADIYSIVGIEDEWLAEELVAFEHARKRSLARFSEGSFRTATKEASEHVSKDRRATIRRKISQRLNQIRRCFETEAGAV